jgi:hypothetical protein|tara:strand:+ start:43856 stop:44041 length:186 start_codon:yes stop_codon:yes gene_type:complete
MPVTPNAKAQTKKAVAAPRARADANKAHSNPKVVPKMLAAPSPKTQEVSDSLLGGLMSKRN